jgi:hypothetical protein
MGFLGFWLANLHGCDGPVPAGEQNCPEEPIDQATVTRESDALDLKQGVFKLTSAKKIAASLKQSAEQSSRRKTGAYRSALSMLTFYIAAAVVKGKRPIAPRCRANGCRHTSAYPRHFIRRNRAIGETKSQTHQLRQLRQCCAHVSFGMQNEHDHAWL